MLRCGHKNNRRLRRPSTLRLTAGPSKWSRKSTRGRRDIYEHPELGFQEVHTNKLVVEHLQRLGLEVKTVVGGNGVIAVSSMRWRLGWRVRPEAACRRIARYN